MSACKALEVYPNSKFLDRLLSEAEPWTDEMTHVEFKKKPTRMFDAASYQAAADEFTSWILSAHGLAIADLPIQVGGVRFDRMTLPYRNGMAPGWGWLAAPRVLDAWDPYFLPVIARGRELGQVTFSDDVQIPRLTHPREKHPWMSYTFSEALSLRPGVRAAKGNVLIGGLGMGWLAREVLRKKGVKDVTIVEQDPDIANFFGEPFKQAFGQRVDIVTGDAFDYAEEHGNKYDRILMDIWHDYGNQSDSRWRRLVNRYQGTSTKLWQWA